MLLQPQYIQRYKDIVRLLLKYNQDNLGHEAGERLQKELCDSALEPEEQGKASDLVDDLEAMGPTFVKIGQLLSTRIDLLPEAYCEALSRLHDKVQPFAFSKVRDILESEFKTKLSDVFRSFDEEPVAAASLGQVHLATLTNGEQVVVKVQRPGVAEQIEEDMAALREAAAFMEKYTQFGEQYELTHHVKELQQQLEREIDFRQELSHLVFFRERFEDWPHLHIPRVWKRLSTQHVLTMEYLEGTKLTEASPLARTEIQGKELARTVFEAYLQQVLEDGMFHADPHPGNVLLLNNNTLGLIDFGMVAEISPGTQNKLTRLLWMMSEGNGEEVAEIALSMSRRHKQHDSHKFREDVARGVSLLQGSSIQTLNMGRSLFDISMSASRNRIRLPSVFTMLGKTLMHLEHLGSLLDPEFNVQHELSQYMDRKLLSHVGSRLTTSHFMAVAEDMRELAEASPRRINRILEQLVRQEFSIKVDAFNQETLMVAMQKIANRITAGLVLAAMLLGSIMLMEVETPYTILGYPILAIVLFLGVFFGGGLLVFRVLLLDR